MVLPLGRSSFLFCLDWITAPPTLQMFSNEVVRLAFLPVFSLGTASACVHTGSICTRRLTCTIFRAVGFWSAVHLELHTHTCTHSKRRQTYAAMSDRRQVHAEGARSQLCPTGWKCSWLTVTQKHSHTIGTNRHSRRGRIGRGGSADVLCWAND